MKTWLPIVVAAGLAFVLGLVLGLRGCSRGDVTKLLQENAELKAEVTAQRALAKHAEDRRAEHAAARNEAEREAKTAAAQVAAADDAIKTLRGIVKARTVAAQCEPERELIAALDVARVSDRKQIDFMGQALDAAKLELEQGYQIEQALNKALMASESRADKLEKHVGKSRRHKIAIGVGSALGGAALTLGAVAAAGRLQ